MSPYTCLSRAFNANSLQVLKSSCRLRMITRGKNIWTRINDTAWYHSGDCRNLTFVQPGHAPTRIEISKANRTTLVNLPCSATAKDSDGHLISTTDFCSPTDPIQVTPVISFIYSTRNTLVSTAREMFINAQFEWKHEDLNLSLVPFDYSYEKEALEAESLTLNKPVPVIEWKSRSMYSSIWTWIITLSGIIITLMIIWVIWKKIGSRPLGMLPLVSVASAMPVNESDVAFYSTQSVLIQFSLAALVSTICYFMKIVIRLSCHGYKATAVTLHLGRG